MLYNLVPQSFKPLLERAGLSRTLRFHGKSHTATTLFLSQGVNPKVVQEMLVHFTVTITLNIYSQDLPDRQEKAVSVLQDALSDRRLLSPLLSRGPN